MAQTRLNQGECRPDEMDMGDYCASLQPEMTGEEQDKRRVTGFRRSSMMPGRTGAKPASTPIILEPVLPPVEQAPAEEFVVQLGAFSNKQLAQSVADSVESPGLPIHVIALNWRDTVLWACVQGPFSDRNSAVIARDLIRGKKKFRSAYIKTLNPEMEQGLAHDSTKK
jgi:cell division septation protein DedD